LRACVISFHVAGWEDLGWNGEPFVVNEPTVNCEESHQQHKISVWQNEINSTTFELVVKENANDATEEVYRAMAHITEHHSKQEWERSYGHWHWVSF
tara:strand:- start:982 stop:1272 length:291 start_codon:yes stop_codon:yes gene_type:complete